MGRKMSIMNFKKREEEKETGLSLLLSNAKTLYKKCRYTLPRMNIKKNLFLQERFGNTF